jgi:hypothetical protein
LNEATLLIMGGAEYRTHFHDTAAQKKQSSFDENLKELLF